MPKQYHRMAASTIGHHDSIFAALQKGAPFAPLQRIPGVHAQMPVCQGFGQVYCRRYGNKY